MRVAVFRPSWYGVLFSRRQLDLGGIDYWVQVKEPDCWRYEVAGRADVDWRRWLDHGVATNGAQSLEFEDADRGRYRQVRIVGGRLHTCVFVSRSPNLPSRQWLSSLFASAPLDAEDRRALLAGEPLTPGVDPGPIVCACYGVGRTAIETAVTERDLDSVDAIGADLQAGTNCGSCRPEISAIIAAAERHRGAAHRSGVSSRRAASRRQPIIP